MPKKYNFRKDFTFEGKRYTVQADSEKELYMKLANKKRDLEEGRVRISGNTLVSAWVEKCLATYKPNIDDDYSSQIEGRLNKHVISRIGNRPLKSIRPVELQDILNAQAGYSESHITKLYQEICFIFQKAKVNHLIIEDPSADLVRPSGYKGHRRSITEYEREHVLKVCDQDPRFVFFLLMLLCGCRAKEVRYLQGMDIQMIDGTRVLHIRGTKSSNADRYVPLPDSLYQRIKSTPKFCYICLTQKGTQFNKQGYHRLTERFRRELNLSMGCRTYRNALVPPFPLASDFVPYFLRHTYCTDLARKGVDIRTAQYLMGHSDISITANIYTHVNMDQVKAAAALLAQ